MRGMMHVYCVDEITIVKWNGYDSWNEPESASEVDVKGYVEFKTRLVRDQKGEEVVSEVMVYLPRRVETVLGRKFSLEDRIIVQGESLARAIISIGKPKAFSGGHYEVFLA